MGRLLFRELVLSEVELGPHFITVYGKDRRWMLELARVMYTAVRRTCPDIAAIQQPELAHEPHDPRVYHTLGQPVELGKRFRWHFHIRYGRKPVEVDRELVVMMLSKFCKIGELEYTVLDDPNYPTMDFKNDEEYLVWLDKIRNND